MAAAHWPFHRASSRYPRIVKGTLCRYCQGFEDTMFEAWRLSVQSPIDAMTFSCHSSESWYLYLEPRPKKKPRSQGSMWPMRRRPKVIQKSSKALLCKPPSTTGVPSRHSECTGMTSQRFARHLRSCRSLGEGTAGHSGREGKHAIEARAHRQRCFGSRPERQVSSLMHQHLYTETHWRP